MGKSLARFRPLGLMALLFVSVLILGACTSTSPTPDNSRPPGEAPAAMTEPQQFLEAIAVNLPLDFPVQVYQGEAVLGGSDVYLSDLIADGRPVILNFWAGLCPPCRAEMPDLQLFHEDFKDRITLVGIDVGQYLGLGSERDARNLLSQLGITYPAGFTNDASVIRKYEVFGMPTTVFITPRGEVFDKWTGLLNRDILADISNQMLALES